MQRLQIFYDDRIAGWIEKVERGEQVILMRNGIDIAELKPIDAQRAGLLAARINNVSQEGCAIVVLDNSEN